VSLSRRIAAEWLGTAFLLAAVVGSGIMGERLAGGNVAVALLANSVATGAALVALILSFGGISGAHFNPLVTAGAVWGGSLSARDGVAYLAAQVSGAIAGVVAANVMFELPLLSLSQHARHGGAQLFSESLAAFGLVFVIRSSARLREPAPVALAVGAYIAAAYWFTSSTSFANPAVTCARALSDSFAGIRPGDVPGFVLAQIGGAGAAVALSDWFAAKP
jgi:glycerol uptake facilitator-like aquaporin